MQGAINTMKHRGFTLIELLVVIAIIAILAAILFPVFAQAKLQAKKTASLSNSKQLTLGVMMYITDADDVYELACPDWWYYPWYNSACDPGGAWSWDSAPYIKNAGVFQDSTDTGKQGWQTWYTGQPAIPVSYAANGFMEYSGGGWQMHGLMGMAQGPSVPSCTGGTGWMASDHTNASANTVPAGTVLLSTRVGGADIWGANDLISGVPPNWGWDSGGANAIPTGSGFSKTWNDSGAGPQTGPYYAPKGTGGNYLVNADARNGACMTTYFGLSIFTFADGHAKAMPPMQTDPDPINAPQNNMWNAYR